jgi:hypothetical protein
MSHFRINLFGRENLRPGYHTASENRSINGIGPTPSPEDNVSFIFLLLASGIFMLI